MSNKPERLPPQVWASRLKEMRLYFEHRYGGETEAQRNRAARRALKIMEKFTPDPKAPLPPNESARHITIYDDTFPDAAKRMRALTAKIAASCPPPMRER